MAAGIPVLPLRERGGNRPAVAAVVAVLGLPLSGLCDRRDGALQNPYVAASVVLGRLPGDHSDAGDLGPAAATPARAEAVRDVATMLHKLRRAMVNPDRELLTGVVEVGECFVAATSRGSGMAAGKASRHWWS